MGAIEKIHSALGLNGKDGLYLFENKIPPLKNLKKFLEQSVQQPHSAFCIDNKPFILFYDSPSNKDELSKAIWNFNEVPIIFFVNEDSIEIYNGFQFLKDYSSLATLTTSNDLTDFGYFHLVSGQTWNKFQEQLSYRNRVDNKLLENIKALRALLILSNLDPYTSNALVGKIIFARYLIDRKVRISFNSNKPKEWKPSDLCDVLQSRDQAIKFFKYLDDTFNGELFQIDNFRKINQSHLNLLINLLKGVELSTGQQSLFDVFDFSIIPVEFISNVYELFIGHEEQSNEGAYYTPLFLVQYIISQTVEKHLNISRTNYNCKVLDPACGSGIFLVETLRNIIEKFNSLNPDISTGTKAYRDNIRRLVEENIFGVDKDSNAISVAIFSIYVTLLDYQMPKDIEKFKFPKFLGKNFFVADFFDLKHKFNDSLSQINFDFILGNPPWKRGYGSDNKVQEYIKQRSDKERNHNIKPSISNKEIAQAFLIRSTDFAISSTVIGLVVTSKVLYNIYGTAFRKYFLTSFSINQVFELAAVRREVFDKSEDSSIAPAAVIIFTGNKPHSDSSFLHISIKPNTFFSLFKSFLIQRNDVKNVKQHLLVDYDWLWKVLLYGSFLDFYFLKRLKELFQTIKEVADSKGSHIGIGVTVGIKDPKPAEHLIGKPFIRTKEDISPFKVSVRQTWTNKIATRPREPEQFKSPLLLITKGISPEFKATSAVVEKDDLVYTGSIAGLQCNDLDFLYTACGYLNSSFFSYFALIATSSAGVEREQTHIPEKFSLPFKKDSTVLKLSKEIHAMKTEPSGLFAEGLRDIGKNIQLLDQAVLKTFKLTKTEHALVNYAIEVTIPTIMRLSSAKLISSPLKVNDPFLTNYFDVFISRFEPIFSKQNKSFRIEVWYSRNIVGVFFQVSSINTEKSKNVTWAVKDEDEMMNTMMSLGHQQITEKLFIQKDIRGFEKTSFYIFKPNEKRLWHEALAYSDVNDFLDAILRAGKEGYKHV